MTEKIHNNSSSNNFYPFWVAVQTIKEQQKILKQQGEKIAKLLMGINRRLKDEQEDGGD